MTEFRMSAVIQLPSDEFERAAAIMECGKAKAALLKILAEHKLSAAVTHETVTPRTAKPIPSAPSVTSHPVAALLSGIPDDQINALTDSVGLARITTGTAAPLRGRAAAE